MPCFKGLAVSIHTPDGPLAEHSIQKHNRTGRITSYIAVPPPKVPLGSTTGKSEQSCFAVSITLLVPGQDVPYSVPKPSLDNPRPKARKVGGLPGALGPTGSLTPPAIPYVPRTNSENETLAAYIYFDGRPKEEVATLLRRGEETWVNSRWVSIPASEGGGLAERDFLFREVGLERYLNGLDLKAPHHDDQKVVTKKQKKLNKPSHRRRIKHEDSSDDDDDSDTVKRKSRPDKAGVLRYGADRSSPVEAIPDHHSLLSSSDSSSDDQDSPETQAAGQIKIALFRVLASGDIKKGEYEAQFNAHDDAGDADTGTNADLDHTTSLSDPRALDPKTISTQTVTGLDGPENPYAIFTFLYRGGKQLRKMGIIIDSPDSKTASAAANTRKSNDFSKLDPLTKFGTVGFSGYRESPTQPKAGSKDPDDMMDSDPEDDDGVSQDNDDDVPTGAHVSSADELRRQRELAEGVRQIKLKRAHSNEALGTNHKSPRMQQLADSPTATPASLPVASAVGDATKPSALLAPTTTSANDATSPFKKQRASLYEQPATTGAGIEPSAITDSPMNSSTTLTASHDRTNIEKETAVERDTNVDEEL